MRTIECPACQFGFMRRRARRCPRCGSILLFGSERFINDEGDRLFYFTDGQWSEVVPFGGFEVDEP